mgnify:CR=1 FL=1
MVRSPGTAYAPADERSRPDRCRRRPQQAARGAAALGRSGDVELASRFAAALASELRAVGITLDYRVEEGHAPEKLLGQPLTPELSRQLDEAVALPDGTGSEPLGRAVFCLAFIAFGIKAAAFPLFFWLPPAYHTPPIAVSAVFAGLLTKAARAENKVGLRWLAGEWRP